MKKISTLLLLMVASLTASAQYQASPEILKARTEFQDNKFGIYIHWGLYSMLGNGEWVMSNRNINYKEYTHLADGFYRLQVRRRGMGQGVQGRRCPLRHLYHPSSRWLLDVPDLCQ